VLITFEAETNGIRKEYGEAKVETVVPPVSLLAEFPVAIVDRVVDKRGTRDAAKAYLDFLYSPAGQEVLVKHFNRVRDPEVAKKHEALFKPVRLVTVEDVFGSWADVQKVHFAEGGTLDQVFVAK
jgi:sulfate/thiosulfate transport system substrate-binding protein